jgi:DNA-binding transcriptional regulator GbsR (MarR family)
MDSDLIKAREHFINGLSRIAHFWGFPKGMGAIYGAIYLSPDSITLDDIVETVGITKGAVSTNVRVLERMGMIHRHVKLGDRKDYYTAETDFWKIIRGILNEREKNEFNLALKSVSGSLQLLKGSKKENDLVKFTRKRISEMSDFFDALDKIVAAFVAVDNLRSATVQKLFNLSGKREAKP